MGTAADAARELRAIAGRRADMTPILRVVAQDIQTYVDDRFQQQNTPNGQPWADLSEAALMSRARRVRGYNINRTIGPLREGERRRTAKRWTRRVAERVQAAVLNAKPLLDTGRLRGSITTQVGPRSLSFGTNVVYAAKQNFGDSSNKFGGHPAPVPSRQFLPVSSDGRTLEPDSFWSEAFAAIEHWIATGEIR